MSLQTADVGHGAIELSHLSRRFGRTTAVDDVSLSVPAGTMCGFIGLNGAGKTTTIRMLVGLLSPTLGCVRVAGCDLPAQRQQVKLRIGYVPDHPTVYGWMRVSQAIAFCRSLYGQRWDQTRCDELMKTLRLDPDRRVKDLSKGAGAKLSLLLAIGHDPEVLILDEPTSGFDPLARDEFLEGILSVNSSSRETDRRRTVLFSSHALDDVQRMADSVALLHEGRLLFHEPVNVLLEKTKRIRAVFEDVAGGNVRVPPAGMVHQRLEGREWTVTVKDFSPQQLEFISAKNRLQAVEVRDLTLDELFRDYVRT